MKRIANSLLRGGLSILGSPFRLLSASGLFAKQDGKKSLPQSKDHQMVVRILRFRSKDEPVTRRKRLEEFKTFLKNAAPPVPVLGISKRPPSYSFRTKVPFRLSKEARELLDELTKKHPKGVVVFPKEPSTDHKLMLKMPDIPAVQVGEAQLKVTSDPKLVNVKNHGVDVLTNAKGMLIVRLHYPSTPSRVHSRSNANQGEIAHNLRTTEQKR